ncbi:hypothetical protein Tco_1217383 [Tanacetum coccineum]
MLKSVNIKVAGGGGGEWRVRESDGGDRIDRSDGESFGLRRKNPPEKFSGGGGGRRLPEKMNLLANGSDNKDNNQHDVPLGSKRWYEARMVLMVKDWWFGLRGALLKDLKEEFPFDGSLQGVEGNGEAWSESVSGELSF